MKKLILCLFFLSAQLVVFSQKVYFIYLQSEPQQAFYLKMGGKIYSSSASGYLILSKLRDSSYNFSIGFPGGKTTEYGFTVGMNRRDHGYLLKDFGDKGWGLFDLQTMAVQTSQTGTAGAKEVPKEINKDVSAFTSTLSIVADDPTIAEKTVRPVAEVKEKVEAKVEEKKTEPLVKTEEPKVEAKVEEKKAEPIVKTEEPKVEEKPAEKKAEPVVKTEEPKVEEKIEAKVEEKKTETVKTEPDPINAGEKKSPVVPETRQEEPVYKPTVITRRSESSTTEGFGLVFTDDDGKGMVDTIRLLIPEAKPLVAAIKEEPKEERKFIEIVPADTVKVEKVEGVEGVEKVEKVEKVEGVIRNNCPWIAGQKDFFELRKRMASVPGDEDMIDEAKKYFRTKCFTSQQVKNLSALFLADEGKYKFFDAAYAYVSDPENFPLLQGELKDSYYVTRFKAMLR